MIIRTKASRKHAARRRVRYILIAAALVAIIMAVWLYW